MWKKMKDLLLTLLAITVTIAIGGLIVYVLYDGYQHLTTFTIFCAGLFGVLIFFLESISKLEEYLRLGITGQTPIKDGVRYLVCNLIGMAFRY